MSERDLSVPERDPVAEWEGGSTATSVGTSEPVRGGVAGWVGARLEAAVARVMDGFAAARRPRAGAGRRQHRRARAHRRRDRALDLVSARRSPGDGGDLVGGGGARGLGDARDRRQRSRHRRRCGGRGRGAVDRLGTDRGAAREPPPPPGGAPPAGAHLRSAGDPRSALGRGARHRARATHRRLRARRAPGGLVADPLPEGDLALAQLLPRDRLRLPARRRHRRADLDRGRRGACCSSRSRPRSGCSFTARRCSRSSIRSSRACASTTGRCGRPRSTSSPGDAIEVVGRLSRRLDPTARAESGRNPPQRRTLRSGTRVPVMIKKLVGARRGARRACGAFPPRARPTSRRASPRFAGSERAAGRPPGSWRHLCNPGRHASWRHGFRRRGFA